MCDVYISTGVVRVVKCRLGWAEYVARMDIREELCDVYISTGVVRVVKCRLGWTGYVARMDIT
jgi:hypothetical protein